MKVREKHGRPSLIHSGLSGFGIKLRGQVVCKWTRGSESSKKLRASYEKQVECISSKKLSPIIACDAYGYIGRSDDEFYFDMPFMDYPSGFTVRENLGSVKSQIRKSLVFRSFNSRPGFHSIVRKELLKYPNSKEKVETIRLLDLCSDIYPHGYAHGDFGFANMLVKDGQIHMIDFTETFIDSPLIDVVMLGLSLNSDLAGPWHKEVVSSVYGDFFEHRLQIEVLRRCKIISFFKDHQTPSRVRELLDLFYA